MSGDSERVREDYDRMADAYAEDSESEPAKAGYERPAMLAMAGDVRGMRVLDAGCAAGAFTRALVARGARVVGVDLNEGMIERARSRTASGAEFHVADLSKPMPFLAPASFDLVASSLSLHYLDDWSAPLLEFHRVLKPGGALIVSTHHPMQDMKLSTPPAPYYEKRLMTDTWTMGGKAFEVRFYRRPLGAIVDAIVGAGFLIGQMPEPLPDASRFGDHPALYARIVEAPLFLFVKALKP